MEKTKFFDQKIQKNRSSHTGAIALDKFQMSASQYFCFETSQYEGRMRGRGISDKRL